MDKAAQREMARMAVRAMSKADIKENRMCIWTRMMQLPEVKNAKKVLSYEAMSDEVWLRPVHSMIWFNGGVLAMPVTLENGELEARTTTPTGPFVEGRFGAKEPEGGRLLKPEELQLVIVPCVAFDNRCMRLGHGAGCYDRYLRRCKKAIFIAAAFEAQRIDELCCEEHDVPMDIVVTEKETYRR